MSTLSASLLVSVCEKFIQIKVPIFINFKQLKITPSSVFSRDKIDVIKSIAEIKNPVSARKFCEVPLKLKSFPDDQFGVDFYRDFSPELLEPGFITDQFAEKFAYLLHRDSHRSQIVGTEQRIVIKCN
jgi:hypothetical protein